jgi:hypothetical protein
MAFEEVGFNPKQTRSNQIYSYCDVVISEKKIKKINYVKCHH